MRRSFCRSPRIRGILATLPPAAVAVVIAACGSSAHASAPHQAAATSQAAGSAQTAASAPTGPLALTISDRTMGHPIPAGFVGLSLEYPAVEAYAGKDPRAINPVLVQLIRNLSPDQAPNLRIGGDSTDWTWWPVPGVTKPGGVKYSLGPTFGRVTTALAGQLGARLILGIQLEADSSKIAATEAQQLISSVGRSSIEALELGNEPELYGSFTWYTTPGGDHVNGRPAGYDFTAYQIDVTRISAALPQVPLAGPATGAPKWIPQTGPFLSAHPRVQLATLHRYPLQTCYMPPSSPMFPTVAHLLSPTASRGLADSVAPYVGVAHARHVALRIDEINTDSCGTAPGIANGFASALWALDAVFQMARVGADGVNFHTYPGAPYELFAFKRRGGRWQGSVAPEYYGLQMFAQAAPAGSSLLRWSGALGDVRAWATRAPGGTVHVVLINDDTARSHTVSVRIPGVQGSATLELLRGKGITATTGVTLGGQSYGAATTTGTLTGRSNATTLSSAGGAYQVQLPQASAALLTLTPPQGG